MFCLIIRDNNNQLEVATNFYLNWNDDKIQILRQIRDTSFY